MPLRGDGYQMGKQVVLSEMTCHFRFRIPLRHRRRCLRRSLFGFEFAVGAIKSSKLAMAMRRLIASSLRSRSYCSSPTGPGQLGGVQEIAKPVSTHGEIGEVSGIPEEHLKRKVVIYSPSRCTTQSGPATDKWKISFESVNKWENPLMGWTSTGDPYHSVGEASLNFDSKDRAVEFAEKYGWQYTIREPHQAALKPKAYADNFKWKGPVPEYD